jgi:hypothetical protein
VIEQVFDSEDKCIAVCEWALVNKDGILDDNGTYIFVKELWIWKGVKGGYKLIRDLIHKLGETFPQATHGYWKRKKYNGSVRTYTKERIYGKQSSNTE